MLLFSLRSLWATARLGFALSLLVCASCYFAPTARAQMDYAAMDAARMNPNSDSQQGALKNYASGIKRTENSLGRLRSLLYPDVAMIGRFRLTKIDYEGISEFADVIVDEVGGAVRSRDEYKVKLREYQKEAAKSSFKKLLSVIQNSAVQTSFNNNIDEIYRIQYRDGAEPGCVIFAIPTDGLSQEEQNKALEGLNSKVEPIAIFNRFGFIIAVSEHDAAVKPNIEEIDKKYEAQLQEAQRTANAYGAYGASGNGRGNNGGAPSLGNVSGMGQTDGTGIPPELSAEYREEVAAAIKDARISSRKAVLPYVRKRFAKAADTPRADEFCDVLAQADGAAFSFLIANPGEFKDLSGSQVIGSDDSVAKPFASMGATADEEVEEDGENESISSTLFQTLDNSKSLEKMKSSFFAISLVGSPKLVWTTAFNSADDAKDFSDALAGALASAKLLLDGNLDKYVPESVTNEEKAAFKTFVQELIDSVKPKPDATNENNVVVVIDFDMIKNKAVALRPLLGGKEVKSAQELESEEIDWGSVDNNSDDEEENEEENASLNDEDEESESAEEDSDDDPFGGDDDF